VTHADLRTRLRAYADGTLGDAEAELVRAHLASGCVECLRDVFTRPVGLPRAPIAVPRSSAAVLVGIAAGAAVALGIAAIAVPGRRAAVAPAPDAGVDAELARLRDERSAAEARSRERIAQLEARVAESERRVPAAEENEPDVRAEIPAAAGAASSATGPAAPDSEAVPGWLSELLASDATRSLAMTAAPFVAGATGYAVWNVERGVVVVSASGLPANGREPVYRLRVLLDDGRAVTIAGLAASERGTLTVTAALPDRSRRVRTLELFRDPTEAPALRAQVAVTRRVEPAQPAPWRVYP
jgi:hypothetical protein